MNRSFKSVFNHRTGTWQVVSEKVRNAGKTASSLCLSVAVISVGLGAPVHAYAEQFWDGNGAANDGTVGGGGGTWNAATPNWTDASGISNSTWDERSAAFVGAGGIINVDGAINFNGMRFQDNGYVVTANSGSQLNALAEGDGTPPTIIVDSGVAATIAAPINGAAGLVKAGAGTLILANVNDYTGTTEIKLGTLLLGNDLALGDSAVKVTGDATLGSDAGNRTLENTIDIAVDKTLIVLTRTSDVLTLGEVISGDGALSKSGTGTLVLSGANTFSGGIRVADGGSLVVNHNTALGSGVLTIDGATQLSSGGGIARTLENDILLNTGLTLPGTSDFTLNGKLSGDGSLTKNGAGNLVLNGSNAYTGGTTLNSGSLTVGDDNALGTGTLNVTGTASLLDGGADLLSNAISLGTNATLNVSTANTLTLSGEISGNGELRKQGSGVLTLTGNNAYFGGTVLNSGTLLMGNSNAIGIGALTVGGASTLDSSSALNLGNSVNLNNALTLTGNYDLTLDGTINGNGSLIKQGNSVLTLTQASNAFSGSVNLQGGRLLLGDNAALGSANLSVTGNAGLGSSTNSPRTLNNAIDVATGKTLELITSGASDLTLGGTISGDGMLYKTGTGTLTLSGINTYTGGTSITAGTLQVSAASALGDGPLTLAGGALRATATFNLATNVTVASGTTNRISADAANTVILTQAINSGDDAEVHFGSATDNGTIQLNSSTGSIGSNVSVWIDGGIVRLGTATVNLVSGAASTHIASGAQLNLNGYDYALANLQGAGSLALDSATATISEGNFSGAMSGIGGSVVKTSTGTLTLSGINTYTGGTIINAGTLLIDSTGSLASPTTVNNGGTLGGTGAVGTLTVNSGGILAPGNSIGTLTVNGNLTMNAGSIYQVEANAAGDSDKTIVNGTATLNGNVVALPDSGGAYKANTQYTILTAANPLIGQFNSNVTSSLAFLDASVSQDTNNVYLNLRRNDINYADVATTRNQRNVATALQNTFAAGNGTAAMDDVLTSVNNLSADKARAAFDSMSGAGLVGLQRAGANFTGNFSNQLNSRLQSAGMGRTAQSINGVQLAANDRLGDLMPALAQNTMSDAPSSSKFSMGGGVPVDDGKRGFWLRGYGFDQDTDGDGNAASTRIKGVGISAGFDKRIQNNLVVGAAFSHGTSDVRASFAETGKSRASAIAAYASYATGPWTFNGNLMLAHNANTMNRNVTVGALTNTARTSFDSKTVSAYGEASYDLPQATWTLQPLAGLSVAHNRNDGFSETGAGALNIQAASQSITSTKSLFGARALFEFDGIHVQPRAIWAHEFGDVNKGMTAQLQGAPAATFTTYGVDLPRDSLITGVTVAGRMQGGLSLFADVQGEFNSKQTGLALLVGVRKSW